MAATGVTLAFLAGCVILVLGQIFLTPLARLLGSTDTILSYARSYLRIILLGAPYMTASFVLNNQLRFQGSAAYGMVGIAAGAVLNVGLDPLLIFRLNMGVAGAALATILSQLASFCMLLLGCARGGNLRIRLKNLCFRRDLFVEIGKGGLPSLCRQGLASIATICLNRSAGLYGDAAIAAMSVVSRAMMLAQSALIGFGQGFQPVCGFNYGAGLYHRVKEGFRFCVKWSTVFLTAVSVLGLVLAPQIIAVFRNDPEVIAFGARALRLQCLAFPLCGVIVISSMLTQTINKVWQASVLAVARQGLFFIPAVLALPHIWGELGVQLAQPVSDVCAFALTVPWCWGSCGTWTASSAWKKSDKKDRQRASQPRCLSFFILYRAAAPMIPASLPSRAAAMMGMAPSLPPKQFFSTYRRTGASRRSPCRLMPPPMRITSGARALTMLVTPAPR